MITGAGCQLWNHKKRLYASACDLHDRKICTGSVLATMASHVIIAPRRGYPSGYKSLISISVFLKLRRQRFERIRVLFQVSSSDAIDSSRKGTWSVNHGACESSLRSRAALILSGPSLPLPC
jgi:hypothetical protein